MFVYFTRAIILYVVVLIVIRLMGKREIGQLQPFEFVITLMIANLATIPMAEIGVPIINGIVPIMGLLISHLVIALLNLKFKRFRKIICGTPTILINKGKVNYSQLKIERFTLNDLKEKLREKDIFTITDVEYAILETNGEVSVIKKSDKDVIRKFEKESI